jgi:hypothetical protein
VAEGVPTVPLQRDLEKSQKSLRLKVSATEETLELDLRKENDLARSRLLHPAPAPAHSMGRRNARTRRKGNVPRNLEAAMAARTRPGRN